MKILNQEEKEFIRQNIDADTKKLLLQSPKENIDINEIESIYYDKIDYNYCFVEYFFSSEINALKTQDVIPIIFSTYHNAHHLPIILRTNGSGEFIEFKDSMQNIIIL